LTLGIAIRLESYQGVSQVNENVDLIGFFTSQIFPELQDTNHANRPMVKATALKFVCTFRKQFTTEQLVSLIPLLISHLSSPSIVVHTLAAYAIERCLIAADESAATGGKSYKISATSLKHFLEPLFTGLFAIIDNPDFDENEHVMKCTMRSLARAGEDVIPVTGVFFSKLASALERVCKNPRNPSYNHYLFESIAALVRNVCSKDRSKTADMEAMLFQPFQLVLQMDITEFSPYVFQILAQLLEYRPQEAGLGDAYKNLFTPLLTASLWESRGNVPGLVRLLSAYLKKAASELLGSMQQMLGIWQKLNASKATEGSAFDLLNAITTYVPLDNLQPYLKTVFQIMMTKLSGAGKSSKYHSLAVHYFALFSGLHGANSFFDCANSIQQGVGLTLLSQIWVPKMQTAATTRLGAKIQVVGLTRVLFDTSALLQDDNGKRIWAEALIGVLAILSSPTLSAPEAEADDDVEVEIGYDSTYTKLSLATSKPEDPFSSIADPMRAFATSLQSLNTANAGVLAPIANSDPKVLAGLQFLVQKTGVNFGV
jgi:exportin-2 (importin alpha re-exporter)